MVPTSQANIWVESQKFLQSNQILEQSFNYGYSTLIFIGSCFGGKTSIIDRFINASNSNELKMYEETIALEYRFAKKSEQSSTKVCNIWELGNELLFVDLLKFCLNVNTIKNTSLIIVLDLTRPNELAILLEEFLQKIRSILNSILTVNRDIGEELKKRAQKRCCYYRSDEIKSTDQLISDPLLIPLTIIGSKYDEFQNMESEIKKQITKYLRTMAYVTGGQLLYHSSKSPTLTKRVNQVFEILAFEPLTFDAENKGKPSISLNIAKPVLVPFGYDTPAKIGDENLNQIREQFVRMFPQKDLEQSFISTISVEPRFDSNFSEPEIDKILEYKYMLLDSNSKN